jgi:hypothetical protein
MAVGAGAVAAHAAGAVEVEEAVEEDGSDMGISCRG